jgi:ApbE superfamily uncharacterized protein (UPF0280 family)
MTAFAALLDDGRLHLQHGPIDLVIGAEGRPATVDGAYRRAIARFDGVLEALVAELPLLKTPLGDVRPLPRGPVARRMVAAVWPFRAEYVTPMAAVAGAVADEVLAAMTAAEGLAKAYVNDGGDIAFHLAPGQVFHAGLVTRLDAPAIDAVATVRASQAVRGIATSGRGGRSFSRGIADAVTVLAATAADADAAATLLGNAVDVASPAVVRRPARQLDPETDLGDVPVTVSVGDLATAEIAAALDAGARRAREMIEGSLIVGAFLALRGETRALGGLAHTAAPAVLGGKP